MIRIKYIVLFILVLVSCYKRPVIEVPHRLTRDLKDRREYNLYVDLLNKSYEGNDTKTLAVFLSYDFVDKTTGACHGKICAEMLREKGDSTFFEAIKLLGEEDKNSVYTYFLLADEDKYIDLRQMINDYPKSLEPMKIYIPH